MTVVLLHGFGAPGDDLAGLSDMISVPPGTTLVFPEALHDLGDLVGPMGRGARAWWMIDMARLETAIRTGAIRDLTSEVPHGLDESREAVVAFLDALEKEEGVSLDRLALGGFSQGAMLALDVALRTPRPIESLVLLSGTYIAEREWQPRMKDRKDTRVFQSHGVHDPILPYVIAEKLRDALGDAGLDVTFDRFEGGHTIPPSTLKRLGAWLSAPRS
jgi:phospholipase/carboxylesterase